MLIATIETTDNCDTSVKWGDIRGHDDILFIDALQDAIRLLTEEHNKAITRVWGRKRPENKLPIHAEGDKV